MKHVQEGDPDAYRALLDDIRPALLSVLRRWTADRDELQDLTQEALLALHRARHSFDPSRPFEPWLFSIVRYVAMSDRHRRMRRVSWEVLDEEIEERSSAPDLNPEAGLGDMLARLPTSQREAFTLLKLDGLSVDEAARQAGTTVGALKVRAHRAYKAIKQMLGR